MKKTTKAQYVWAKYADEFQSTLDDTLEEVQTIGRVVDIKLQDMNDDGKYMSALIIYEVLEREL